MIDRKFSKIILDKLYQDTMLLLFRSESYLGSYNSHSESQHDQLVDLRINCEMTRITARLTRVMAWLLAQKAAADGEFDLEEANSLKYRVVRDPFCLKDSVKDQEKQLPALVMELLKESLSLYERALVLCENSLPISSDQMPESES